MVPRSKKGAAPWPPTPLSSGPTTRPATTRLSRSASAERVWRHRHVDLALGPRPRAHQVRIAAADKAGPENSAAGSRLRISRASWLEGRSSNGRGARRQPGQTWRFPEDQGHERAPPLCVHSDPAVAGAATRPPRQQRPSYGHALRVRAVDRDITSQPVPNGVKPTATASTAKSRARAARLRLSSLRCRAMRCCGALCCPTMAATAAPYTAHSTACATWSVGGMSRTRHYSPDGSKRGPANFV